MFGFISKELGHPLVGEAACSLVRDILKVIATIRAWVTLVPGELFHEEKQNYPTVADIGVVINNWFVFFSNLK